MTDNARPDILFTSYDILPEGLIADLAADVSAEGIDVRAARVRSGPYAGVELYLPTALGLFLASSYFGGALKKMGEEHYLHLKQAAIKLHRRASAIKLTAAGSKGKTARDERFDLCYSITAELAPGIKLKLVLRADLKAEDVDAGVIKFLDLVRDLHGGAVEDAVIEPWIRRPPMGGVILVTFDPVREELVGVDAFANLVG